MNVKHLRSFVIFGDVAIGKIKAVVGADVTVATAGESGEVTDVLRLVFGDVAYSVPFTGDYLNGILVVGVGRVGFQGGSKLSKVFINVFAMCDACNFKFDIIKTMIPIVFWPYADISLCPLCRNSGVLGLVRQNFHLQLLFLLLVL